MNPQGTYLFATFGWAGVIVGSVAILIITAVVTHLAVRVIHRTLDKATEGRVSGTILENVIRVVFWLAGIGAMLYICFNFDASVIWGALGIGGIALSLGAQSTISNLLGGFQTTASRETNIGDWVTIGTATGKIKDITWRKMLVEDCFGNLYNIPNSLLMTTTVKVLYPYDTLNIPLTIAFGADLERIKAELPNIVQTALEESGMAFEGKKTRFAIMSSDAWGYTGQLKCFADRMLPSDVVTDVVTEAALSYLGNLDALPKSQEHAMA